MSAEWVEVEVECGDAGFADKAGDEDDVEVPELAGELVASMMLHAIRREL